MSRPARPRPPSAPPVTGAEGRALIPNYPHLAGQNAAYLVKQLKAFKDGSRKEPLMVPFMAPLTDADMENLAAYYASLK